MTRGVFVVIEGIDGAGTTTQARRLVDRLASEGRDAHLTREPSDGPVGRLLREILGGAHAPVDATTLGLLFAADRADHLQREIEPRLAAGAVVVSDRYVHSSLAYQGAAEDRNWVAELNRRARTPDLTLFLEIDAELAAKRRADAGRTEEIFDGLETQRAVAAKYREVMADLGERERIVVVDGAASLDSVATAVWTATTELLGGDRVNRLALVLALALGACRADAGGAAEPVAVDRPSTASSPAATEADEPVIVPAREGWIDRETLDSVLDAGVGVFLGGLEVEAVFDDRSFVGWRILRSDNPWVDVRPGDVLLEVNGAPIETPDQVQSLWESLRGAESITASLLRKGRQFEIHFRVGLPPQGSEAP